TVVAQLTDDPKNPGKWQATDVEKAVALPVGSAGKTAGVVMSWLGTYGFIEFVDGRRAYCHSSACGGVSLQPGETVVGTLAEDLRTRARSRPHTFRRRLLTRRKEDMIEFVWAVVRMPPLEAIVRLAVTACSCPTSSSFATLTALQDGSAFR
ncbi:unnamed protein product, partial [Prorocentrum cordatum]